MFPCRTGTEPQAEPQNYSGTVKFQYLCNSEWRQGLRFEATALRAGAGTCPPPDDPCGVDEIAAFHQLVTVDVIAALRQLITRHRPPRGHLAHPQRKKGPLDRSPEARRGECFS